MNIITAGLARLFLVLLCLTLAPLPAFAERVHVAQVVDGDTLRLTDGRSLRLAGIDSPELGHGKEPDQLHAQQSRDMLHALVANKALELRPVTTQGKDRHKRVLAEVLLPDGASLNEALLAQGAAYAYWHKDLDVAFWQRLLERQSQALREKKGLWADLLRLPVAQAPYVGNKNSRRFFPENCKNARDIKDRNRVPFAGLAAAFEAGYAPARVCVFWPTL